MKTALFRPLRAVVHGSAFLTIVLSLLLPSAPRLSAQSTWTNTAGGDWNLDANWNPNGVPGAGQAANLNFLGTPTYAVNYNAAMAAASVGAVTVATNGGGTGVRATLNVNAPSFLCSSLLAGNGGIVNIGAGGVFTNLATTTTTLANGTTLGGCLTNNGGIFAFNNGTLTCDVDAGGKLVCNSGVMALPTMRISRNSDGAMLMFSGGTATIYAINGYRGGDNTTSGFLVNNATAVVTVGAGGISLGTGNSWCDMTLSAGTVTNNGGFNLGNQSSATRGGRYLQTGGTLVTTNVAGITLCTVGGNVATLTVGGGTTTAEKVTLINATTLTNCAATLTVSNTGALYLGSGGIVQNAVASGSSYTVNLGPGGGTLGAKADWSSGVKLTLNAGTATLNAADAAGNAHNLTLSGILSGAGSLAKTGAGLVTLSATNTYTGTTAANAGKLAITTASAASGAYWIAAGATLGIQVAYPGSTLTMASLTAADTAVMELDVNTGNPSAPIITNTGALTLNGTVTVNVKGNLAIGGPFTLLRYGGARSGAGSFVLGALPPGFRGTLNDDTVNQALTLAITAADAYLTWLGGGTGAWDLNDPANLVWKGNPSGGTTYYMENLLGSPAVRLDDTATAPSPIAITLNTTANPASLLVSNSAKTYSLSGNGGLAGTVGLTKAGTGLFTLATTNTFTGAVALNGGTLNFTSLANLGAGTNLSFGGGTLQYAAGNVDDVSTRTVTINSGGAAIDTGINSVTFANRIGNNGAGGLTKLGSGTLTLATNSTYAGPTTIAQGTLALGAGASLSNSPALIVNGTLDDTANGGCTLNGLNNQVLAGNGTIASPVTAVSATTITPATNGVVGTLTFASDLTLAGATVVLDVSNTSHDLIVVNGLLTLTGGTIQINSAGLANGTYKIMQYASASGKAANLALAYAQAGKIAQLVDSGSGEIDLQIASASSANLVWKGDGVLNYWDVETTKNWLNGGVGSVFANGDSTTFDDTGSITPSVSLQGAVSPGNVVVNSTLNYTFVDGTSSGGGILSGATGLTKSGTGMLTLLTLNNNTGSLLINSGTVQVGDGATLSDLGPGNITNYAALVFDQPDNRSVNGVISGPGTLTQMGPATLTLLANNTYSGQTTVNAGTLQVGAGGLVGLLGSGPIVGVNNGTLAINRSGAYWLTNGFSGAGTLVLAGPGTVTLAGANSYINNTYVNNGTLKLGLANAIPQGGATTGWLILDGGAAAGTLDLNGFDTSVNALSGLAGTVRGQINNNGGTGTNVLRVNGVAGMADTTFAGTVVDNTGSGGWVALVKDGTSTLDLANAANTFSGGSTLYNGILSLGSGSSSSSGGYAGTGPITFLGGTLASAFGSGSRLTVGNPLVVPAGASGTVNLSALTSLTGALTGSGTLDINAIGGTDWLSGNWSGFTGTINIFGGGTATMVINGGNFGAGLASATLTLTNVSLASRNNSTGNTVSFGAITMDSSATIVGSAYAGGMTFSIGGLNGNDLLAGTVGDTGGGGYTALIKVGTGTLSLQGSMTYRGNTTVNAGSLLVGSSSWMASSPLVTVAAGAKLDVSAFNGLALNPSQTVAGGGLVVGALTLTASDVLSPGGAGAAGTLTFSNTVTLDSSAGTVTNLFDLSDDPTGLRRTNDQIVILGDLIVGGNSFVSINPLNTALGAGTYKLFAVHGQLLSGGSPVPTGEITNYVQVGGALASQTRASLLLSNYANQVYLVVGSGPSLLWVGDGSANQWNLTTSSNWLSGGASSLFYQGDAVAFDDSSTNFTVNLTGSLAPGGVTVNSTNLYTFASTGKLTGAAGVSKAGVGTLLISSSGGNDYDGTVAIHAGTLKVGVATALGSTNGATVIAAGATLDVNGIAVGAEPVAVQGAGVGGNGAIINNGAQLVNSGFTGPITLTGDTVLGGSNRWDIYNGSLAGNGYHLTKTGANYIVLTGLGEIGVADIDVQSGYFTFIGNTTLGLPANKLALWPGGRIDFYASSITNNKVVTMTNAVISASSGTNYFAGSIALNGAETFTVNAPLTLSGTLGGPGGLTKNGTNQLTLTGATTYTGPTAISNGVLSLTGPATLSASSFFEIATGATLDASGLASGLFTLSATSTLTGGGTLAGSLSVLNGATLIPGDGLGTLTVTNTATLAGNTVAAINRDAAVSASKLAATAIHYGGTLTVTNLGSAPQLNDAFQLFQGAYSGTFASLALPALGTGLLWSNSLAINGAISVVAGSTVNLTPTNITRAFDGRHLTLSWPQDRTGWRLLTNAVGLASPAAWYPLPGADLTNQITITIDPAQPHVFFRMAYP